MGGWAVRYHRRTKSMAKDRRLSLVLLRGDEYELYLLPCTLACGGVMSLQPEQEKTMNISYT
jgi:hypothetical protein